ncbi:hypothetical protein J2067_003007 [Erwinia rhapontici]|nr:hypothetical protein [Erwinia rhapontici]
MQTSADRSQQTFSVTCLSAVCQKRKLLTSCYVSLLGAGHPQLMLTKFSKPLQVRRDLSDGVNFMLTPT